MLKTIKSKDFDNFVKKVRRIAFETPFKAINKTKLAKQASDEDIEKIITFKEVKLLILDEYADEYTEDYIVINDSYENCSKILDAVLSRLINNELNKMASDGELDCYFDDEINDFRFKFKK